MIPMGMGQDERVDLGQIPATSQSMYGTEFLVSPRSHTQILYDARLVRRLEKGGATVLHIPDDDLQHIKSLSVTLRSSRLAEITSGEQTWVAAKERAICDFPSVVQEQIKPSWCQSTEVRWVLLRDFDVRAIEGRTRGCGVSI
jgi:hypothetical protein